MQLIAKYKWLGLLGIVVALVIVGGLGGLQAARAFTPPATCTTGTPGVDCPPGAYFFADASGGFTADTQCLKGFATNSHGFGPTGIVFHDGKIYVAGVADNTLNVFNSSCGTVTSPDIHPLGGGCTNPIGLTLSPRDGPSSAQKLYVACTGIDAIYEIGFDGSYIRTVTAAIHEPRDMATAKNGDLLVTGGTDLSGGGDSSEIFRVRPTAPVTVLPCSVDHPEVSTPDGIAIDQLTDTIYVANLVMILSPGFFRSRTSLRHRAKADALLPLHLPHLRLARCPTESRSGILAVVLASFM